MEGETGINLSSPGQVNCTASLKLCNLIMDHFQLNIIPALENDNCLSFSSLLPLNHSLSFAQL